MKKFLFIALLCTLFASCMGNTPVINSINPTIGRMGDVLIIHGSGFGEERNQSYVTIAGTPPVTTSYLSWNNEEIILRLPEFGDAGLVYVHRGNNKSNPALFVNESSLPVQLIQEESNTPIISSIEPVSGPIGSVLTIRGNNFGISRRDSGVFFAWDADYPQTLTTIQAQDFVEVCETEFGYEFWSEREIRVRVPDGAVSGNIELRTPRGNSRPVFFEITGMPGTKVFRDRRSYTLSYMVDIETETATTPNALFVWMPQPAISSSQRNIRLLSRSPEPFIDSHRGASIFHFVNMHSRMNQGIIMSFSTDVYTIETDVRNQAPPRLNSPSSVTEIYTLPSDLIRSNDPDIIARSRQIIGNERLPYAQAQRIYNWLISAIEIQTEPFQSDVLEALEEEVADGYTAALLFCSLARAAGIPAIPVEGVLINRLNETIKHFWVEFWIDGFGWIPLDPALGAGAAPRNFTLREDHAEYYFGNLDNLRVSFSRGERFLAQMTPNGRSVLGVRDFSIQNIWEEAIGGLQSYSSYWSDVTITDVLIY